MSEEKKEIVSAIEKSGNPKKTAIYLLTVILKLAQQS